jgi:NADH:ubiquinone oxidoreductase subunit H
MCNYSILGSLRSISQIISFEILLFLIFFLLILIIENYTFLNFLNFQIKVKFIIFLYPLYLIFIIRALIDLNRVPFDLIEGESELVSGLNIEYFRRLFVLIFLSEYINIIFIRILLTIIFYGLSY